MNWPNSKSVALPVPEITALSAPLGNQHQVLCSTHEDELWRQSFLCGRASRVEQFASGSSSRGQFTLF